MSAFSNLFRNYPPLVAVLAVVAILGAPALSRADFELRVSTNGGSSFTTYFSTDGGNNFYTGANNTGTDKGSSVTVSGLAISAGATSFVGIAKSTLDLSVHGTQDSVAYNILVQTSITNVPTGSAPENLSWKFTSSSDLAGLTETGRTWVDQNNAIFGQGNIVADSGDLSAPAIGSQVFSATPPYSFTSQYSLVGNGTQGNNVSADNNDKVTAPAPAGLLLALTGMPVLGFGAWLRRRTRIEA